MTLSDEQFLPLNVSVRFQAKFKAFFEVRHVGDLLHTCFKRRENNDRTLIWMVIFTLASTMFVLGNSTLTTKQ